MTTLISLLFSKLGAIAAVGLAVLGFWFKLKWTERKAAKAEDRAMAAEAQVEIQKVEVEYAPDIKEMEELAAKPEATESDADDAAAIINRLWGHASKSK